MKLRITASIAFALLFITVCVTAGGESNPRKITLTSQNTLVLDDVVNGESVGPLLKAARDLDKENSLKDLVIRDPIYLFIRSPGGEIQTGLEMLDALKASGRPIDTITSFAASMAFQTVQQLGKRLILNNGVLMSHRAKGAFEGEFGGMKPSQIDNRKAIWDARVDELDAKTVARTNGKQTLESYQKQYASEMWLTGAQSVAQGYADEIVVVRCDSSLSGTRAKHTEFMGIPIEYEVDNCPLNSSPMNVRIKLRTNKGLMTAEAFAIAKGGFGSTCLIESGANPNRLCAIDVNLTAELLANVKEWFKTYYMDIRARAVPYRG